MAEPTPQLVRDTSRLPALPAAHPGSVTLPDERLSSDELVERLARWYHWQWAHGYLSQFWYQSAKKSTTSVNPTCMDWTIETLRKLNLDARVVQLALNHGSSEQLTAYPDLGYQARAAVDEAGDPASDADTFWWRDPNWHWADAIRRLASVVGDVTSECVKLNFLRDFQEPMVEMILHYRALFMGKGFSDEDATSIAEDILHGYRTERTVFEYVCRDCQGQFEVREVDGYTTSARCGLCGSANVTRTSPNGAASFTGGFLQDPTKLPFGGFLKFKARQYRSGQHEVIQVDGNEVAIIFVPLPDDPADATEAADESSVRPHGGLGKPGRREKFAVPDVEKAATIRVDLEELASAWKHYHEANHQAWLRLYGDAFKTLGDRDRKIVLAVGPWKRKHRELGFLNRYDFLEPLEESLSHWYPQRQGDPELNWLRAQVTPAAFRQAKKRAVERLICAIGRAAHLPALPDSHATREVGSLALNIATDKRNADRLSMQVRRLYVGTWDVMLDSLTGDLDQGNLTDELPERSFRFARDVVAHGCELRLYFRGP